MSRQKARKAPQAAPPDYTPSQRLQDALKAMGCPRPDKEHHHSQARAEHHLSVVARIMGPAHDDTAQVYACRCGMGWVWGRPVPGVKGTPTP